jgi:uncharacterized protein YrrD
MTSFREAIGRSVLSRDDAEALGTVSRLVVENPPRAVVAVVVGSGRKAAVYRWDQVTGFGPDAVLVEGDPADGEEAQDAASGSHDPLDKRVLTVLGEQVGTVADVEFDPDTGDLRALRSDRGADVTPDHVHAVGSYAAVVDP